MSLSIGIYDLFSYTIPGFLYIFVFNEFFRLIGWNYFLLSSVKEGTELIVAALSIMCAYTIGHLLDYFSNWFCFRLLTRYKVKDASLDNIKRRYPELKIQFGYNDCHPLFTNLRQCNLEFSRVIDSFGANNIMLRNISFGLLLLALLQIWIIILDFHWQNLLIIIGILGLSWVAYLRSRMFYEWFFTGIYEASLKYGTSLKEVLGYSRGTSRKNEDEET